VGSFRNSVRQSSILTFSPLGSFVPIDDKPRKLGTPSDFAQARSRYFDRSSRETILYVREIGFVSQIVSSECLLRQVAGLCIREQGLPGKSPTGVPRLTVERRGTLRFSPATHSSKAENTHPFAPAPRCCRRCRPAELIRGIRVRQVSMQFSRRLLSRGKTISGDRRSISCTHAFIRFFKDPSPI
jgi:hypothetical protein